MAAKQQSRKKAKDMKWKKLLKRNQQFKLKQKKLQSQKKKKAQAQLKRPAKKALANKTGSSGVPRICSPRLFASKMLRRIPKVRMEAKARSLVKTLLRDLYHHMAAHVETLSQKIEEATTSYTDVQTALKGAMEKELAKHTVELPSNECA